ncbi:sugar transporter stl1 [Stemphylium lycopersici]|uniref:General substrate transporter n=1 Tax=Stemphylium lycopersici TaxID=183478 RepID=A0A364N3K9_STELY|nr:sugar transporter stl1 [Stemphylium lycopersici]RAR10295.1 general substrate transporter [Stemphylium lycopersici]
MFGSVKGRVLYRMMRLSCGVSFMLYGYDAGVLGGVQTTEPFLSAMGHPTGGYVIPMIASSYTLAATVCSLFVSVVGMPLGRRNIILLGNLCVIVGASLQASAWSVPHMIVGRLICGFGIGFISCTVPTYMAEMSIEAAQRGPEVAFTCCLLISGIPIAYWIDFGFTRMTNQVSWRFPIGFQAFFAILSGTVMLFLPDTPRWYYAKGREVEGDAVLQKLHNKDLNHPNVQAMKAEIMNTIRLESEKENKFNVWGLFWDKSDLKVGRRIRISFLVLSLQQMMGINLSVYYSTVIFKNIGLSDFLSQLLAAVMNTMFALGTYPLPPTIERFGRQRVMLYSAFVCALLMTAFVALIGIPNPTISMQWGAAVVICIWNMVFGYGWVGVPWLYGPEIAPLKHRHVGGAAGAFGEWLFSFITVFAGGIALDNIGWKIWIWMLLSNWVAMPFVWLMCPETTGKSLEEIDLLFAKKHVRESILAERILGSNTESKEVESVRIEKLA